MKIERTVRYYYRRLQRLKGNPYGLAGGFAIGIFVGLTPTIPLHTAAILLLTLASRTSTVAGILSSWLVCNPLTFVPIYYFSLVIGNLMTPFEVNWQKVKAVLDTLLGNASFTQSLYLIFDLGYEAATVMVVGGCLLALPFSIVSYYLSLRFFLSINRSRRLRKILH